MSLNAQTTGVIAILGAVASLCAAQSPETPMLHRPLAGTWAASLRNPDLPSPQFRSATDLVALDVCVKNRAGQFVPAMTVQDFLVLEDNVPQKLSFFASDQRTPLAVVLLIDRSASITGEELDRAKDAAAAFVRTLRPGDLVEVVVFNERASRLFPLGADHAAAEASINEDLAPLGMTALYEAVLVGLRDLERARSKDYQTAIVVLTDGEDTSSLPTFDDVLENSRRSGVMVYAISLRADERGRYLPPVHGLAQLAFETGGQAVGVRTLMDLVPIYEQIGAELRHLYRLGYVSSSKMSDRRWRSISVRAAKKDVVVRTRSGYYAPRRTAIKGAQ